MPTNILMPALSPTMEEGTLAKWLVKEGDEIRSGDVIAEIETDKATMEVEAVDEGVVGKLLVNEGAEAVKVNAIIAVLLEDGESAGDIAAAPVAASAPTPEEPAAPVAPANTPQVKTPPAPQPTASKPKSNGSAGRIFASPLARRIALDKGLDLSAITGSGPHGRIVKADVEGATPQAAAPTAMAPPPAGADAATVAKAYADRAYQEIPLDGMRKTIAARLTEAKQTVPHFYLRREIELDELLTLRKKLNVRGEERGVKLSVNDFIIKACALALKRVPACNAVWAGDRIYQFEAADVAVAVAIEGGLFTPVLRDADSRSLPDLSSAMKDLAARARDRKLAPHEYQGGAFAISNLGMMGVENFDAVINPPHGSILAVGAGMRKPVVRDEEIGIATMMSVTLSVDHRVIDGALGAEFLGAIKDLLEDPLSMLI